MAAARELQERLSAFGFELAAEVQMSGLDADAARLALGKLPASAEGVLVYVSSSRAPDAVGDTPWGPDQRAALNLLRETLQGRRDRATFLFLDTVGGPAPAVAAPPGRDPLLLLHRHHHTVGRGSTGTDLLQALAHVIAARPADAGRLVDLVSERLSRGGGGTAVSMAPRRGGGGGSKWAPARAPAGAQSWAFVTPGVSVRRSNSVLIPGRKRASQANRIAGRASKKSSASTFRLKTPKKALGVRGTAGTFKPRTATVGKSPVERASAGAGIALAPAPPVGSSSVTRPPKAQLPALDWPPPRPSARMVIPRDLLVRESNSEPSLNDVTARLGGALRESGYWEQVYYRIPGSRGVGLVTRLERIDTEGRPKGGSERFVGQVRKTAFDLGAFLRDLLFEPVGYFRLGVFVLTDETFAPDPHADALTSDEANAMLAGGAPVLSDALGTVKFDRRFFVEVLIYEFESRGSGTGAGGRGDVTQLVPSRLSADQHLRQAGILKSLRSQLTAR